MATLTQRILIIDDDDAHRLLVRRALRGASVEIVEACTIDEAHRALLTYSSELHLVILDMNLKGTPGLDVLSAFRAAFPFEKLPVVLISTSALETDVQRGYQAGANCYIVKDTDPKEFNRALSQAADFFLRR
jgi:CheY-like chemotaxis protein